MVYIDDVANFICSASFDWDEVLRVVLMLVNEGW
jgi:hypothetical protein